MKTILVVDDEYALAETLSEMLRDEGYRVVSAANGKDGLERLQQEKPDLVITDLMMPIADGRDLLRGMRALPDFSATPVILMSATSRSVALRDVDGPTAPVAAFVTKPFTWEKLRDLVVSLIGPGEPETSE